MNDDRTSFGGILARLRQSAGLSQQALAERLSVTRQAVSNWERDQTTPDLDMLRTLAVQLNTDLNTLCASPAPPPAKKRPTAAALPALALCLCGVLCLGLWRSAPGPDPIPANTPRPLAPHRISYVSPSGVTFLTAADGAEEVCALLEALPGGNPGPIVLTGELRDTFSYFAAQYELRFLPGYQDGAFLSGWDQVLLWFYRAGFSGGATMTTEDVDGYVARCFGGETGYTHESTERFPLTESGYRPDCGGFSRGDYTLASLARLEDGGFEAVIREDTEALVLTLDLIPEYGSLRFLSVSASGAQ